MPRKSSLFSLTALTRAYQRNLAALVRVAQPVKGKKRAPVQGSVVARKAVRAGPKRIPSARTSPEWLAGIAPGPAGARRFHLFVPAGLAPAPGELFPLLVMLHGCGQTWRDLAASSRMNRLAARKRFLVLYPEQERVAMPMVAGTGTTAAVARPMPRPPPCWLPWTRSRAATLWIWGAWLSQVCLRAAAWLRCWGRATHRAFARWSCILGWPQARLNLPPPPQPPCVAAAMPICLPRWFHCPQAGGEVPAMGPPQTRRLRTPCRRCSSCMAMPMALSRCATLQPPRCCGPMRQAHGRRHRAPCAEASATPCRPWSSRPTARWLCRCERSRGWATPGAAGHQACPTVTRRGLTLRRWPGLLWKSSWADGEFE